MRQRRPDFMPLLIGIHWPSLPGGDEDLRAADNSTDTMAIIDRFAEGTAKTEPARRALRVILDAAQRPETDSLSPEVVRAFMVLYQQAGLKAKGVGGRPGSDSKQFDPQKTYKRLKHWQSATATKSETVDVSRPLGSNLVLEVYRYLSFATMKARGCLVGETGVHRFLKSLQNSVPSHRDVDFHLMGHSFGCIVMSAAITGPAGTISAIRPVKSLSLIQGALSIWSYTSSIPYSREETGYFLPLLRRRLVTGPIVTTQSEYDRALNWWYRLAATYYEQLRMAGPLPPDYAAVGGLGIQGEDCKPQSLTIQTSNANYGFVPGAVYNVESSAVIRKILGFWTGAHSDIAHAEIAHLVWQAAQVNLPEPKPTPPPAPYPQPLMPHSPPSSLVKGPIRRLIARRRARCCR